MNRRRTVATGFAAAMLLGAVMASPASAQSTGDCGQLNNLPDATQTFTFTDNNRSNSEAVLIGLINAAIQNVEATVPVTVGQLAANVSVVCVTDSLNGNDVRILNGILNNVDVLNDSQVASGIAALNDVNILSIDTGTNTIYVAPIN
jgi:hypothetical protein